MKRREPNSESENGGEVPRNELPRRQVQQNVTEKKSCTSGVTKNALGGSMHSPLQNQLIDEICTIIALARPLVEAIERRDRDLGSQLRRALNSVGLNVAKGFGCSAGNSRNRFETAHGSLFEARAALSVGVAWRYIAAQDCAELCRAHACSRRANLWLDATLGSKMAGSGGLFGVHPTCSSFIWVVLSIEVTLFDKSWALPVLVRLHRSEKRCKNEKRTHYKSTVQARGLIDLLAARYPSRQFQVLGDSAYTKIVMGLILRLR